MTDTPTYDELKKSHTPVRGRWSKQIENMKPGEVRQLLVKGSTNASLDTTIRGSVKSYADRHGVPLRVRNRNGTYYVICLKDEDLP